MRAKSTVTISFDADELDTLRSALGNSPSVVEGPAADALREKITTGVKVLDLRRTADGAEKRLATQ